MKILLTCLLLLTSACAAQDPPKPDVPVPEAPKVTVEQRLDAALAHRDLLLAELQKKQLETTLAQKIAVIACKGELQNDFTCVVPEVKDAKNK